jgi:hypothetical protein
MPKITAATEVSTSAVIVIDTPATRAANAKITEILERKAATAARIAALHATRGVVTVAAR